MKNNIDRIENSDLCQLEEKLYQLSELRYHLSQIKLSIQEATYHLQKTKYHASLIEDINNKFKMEYNNG